MVLSNAERQRRFRERRRQAVSVDDVVRAVRLLYERVRADDPGAERPPFDEWAASQSGRRMNQWAEFLPVDADPKAYPDFAPDDAALLARVAAVLLAAKRPPDLER